MGQYVLRRLGTMLLVIVAVSFLVFALMRSLPGGPWDEEKYPVSPEAKANIMRSFGFDKPPLVQYGLHMWNALPYDFGRPRAP